MAYILKRCMCSAGTDGASLAVYPKLPGLVLWSVSRFPSTAVHGRVEELLQSHLYKIIHTQKTKKNIRASRKNSLTERTTWLNRLDVMSVS